MTARVTIIGGGLAGLAAAESLSRFGTDKVAIRLIESRRQTGGRAGSFHDSASGQTVDYCQHVAMGCCTNFIDFVQRMKLDRHFRVYDQLTFLHRSGSSRFAASRRIPPPLHLAGAFGRLSYLSWPQKCRVAYGVWRLMRTPASELRQLTAKQWLIRNRQDDACIANFWDVILVSALGEHTRYAAADAAQKVILDGFASHPDASDVWVPAMPLSQLFGIQATERIQRDGVDVIRGAPVRTVVRSDGSFQIRTASGQQTSDAVIAAVPWHQMAKIDWQTNSDRGNDWFARFASIPSSAITGIHLWLDRPITTLPHVVLVGTLAQWLFREPIAETKHPSTNDWVGGTPAFYHQIVISGAVDVAGESKEALVSQVMQELRDFFPDARDAKLLRHRVVTDPNSVFSVTPQVQELRPATDTPFDGLFLAGDWVDTGWPSTMEGAVRSGRMAAARVAQRCGLNPSPLTPDLSPGRLYRWFSNRP
ncbi:hydroxysqualene dehydroxylase HpnE [Crateriforma spongiae]|uniref:hydroxysqualene dehydroxylase HpnE n=1 Tax=Crateriforma spongiae TaxID=2724528 RepID=UPI001445791A|nr:hydroxysqualene dehydroxylase HpnE [Crateriforma spongiae]